MGKIQERSGQIRGVNWTSGLDPLTVGATWVLFLVALPFLEQGSLVFPVAAAAARVGDAVINAEGHAPAGLRPQGVPGPLGGPKTIGDLQ